MEKTVVFDYETGWPKDVVSSVLRRISAYTRTGKVNGFKIGITCSPIQRFKRGYVKYYDKMIVIYRSLSIDSVSQLECKLIDHNKDLADNIIAGGGGNFGNPPYFMYLVIKY